MHSVISVQQALTVDSDFLVTNDITTDAEIVGVVY